MVYYGIPWYIFIREMTQALFSLLFNEETGHGPVGVVEDFVDWCDKSCMCLNATKTKDMCIDFRNHPPPD